MSSKSDRLLDKLQSPCSKEHHTGEDDAVFPSLDVSVAIEPLLIANRYIYDFKVLLIGAKKQIEIAERIEIPEVGAAPVDTFIVFAPKDLGTAQRILKRLSQEPGEYHAESLVRAKIGKLHCSLVHGVDQPHSIGEVCFARSEHLDELR